MATSIVTGVVVSQVCKDREKVEKEYAKQGKDRDGDKYGKRTGLPLTAFVDALLYANEKAQASDGALQAELEAEYPNRGKGKSQRGIQAISAYRSYFNRSQHGHNPAGKASTCHGRRTEGDATPRRAEAHPLFGRPNESRRSGAKKTAKGAKGSKGAKKAPAKKAPAKKTAKKAPAKV